MRRGRPVPWSLPSGDCLSSLPFNRLAASQGSALTHIARKTSSTSPRHFLGPRHLTPFSPSPHTPLSHSTSPSLFLAPSHPCTTAGKPTPPRTRHSGSPFVARPTKSISAEPNSVLTGDPAVSPILHPFSHFLHPFIAVVFPGDPATVATTRVPQRKPSRHRAWPAVRPT
jgi:hypothetical protein